MDPAVAELVEELVGKVKRVAALTTMLERFVDECLESARPHVKAGGASIYFWPSNEGTLFLSVWVGARSAAFEVRRGKVMAKGEGRALLEEAAKRCEGALGGRAEAAEEAAAALRVVLELLRGGSGP
jgi:hypothetical protein